MPSLVTINPHSRQSVARLLAVMPEATKIQLNVIGSQRTAKRVNVQEIFVWSGNEVYCLPYNQSITTQSPIIQMLTRGFTPQPEQSTGECWVLTKGDN